MSNLHIFLVKFFKAHCWAVHRDPVEIRLAVAYGQRNPGDGFPIGFKETALNPQDPSPAFPIPMPPS
jgi:hypothetical protein